MKKQALLLIALVSCANASALTMPTLTMPAMPTVDVQAYKEALTTVLSHKNTPIIVCSTAFAAALFYIIYKFHVDGGYANNSGYDWAKEKESESYFMKYGTSFPTEEQLRSKELLPAVATPVAAEESAPVATQDQSALDKQDAYFNNLVEQQMEILS